MTTFSRAMTPYELLALDPVEVDKHAFGFDTETHLIACQQLAPPIVCAQVAWQDAVEMRVLLAAIADPDDKCREMAMSIVRPESPVGVAHNAAFDLAVIIARWPESLTMVIDSLLQGRIRCTRIREKLLRLAMHGDLKFQDAASGTKTKADFSLAGLVMQYFNVDIKASKTGEDAWRLNYRALEHVTSDKWPPEAVSYAVEDSVWALKVCKEQERIRQQMIHERGIDAFVVQDVRVLRDFVLHLMSCRGVAVDNERKHKIEAEIREQLDPAKFKPLYELGLLIPAQPSRPHKNNPSKMTMAKPESKSTKAMQEYVLQKAREMPDKINVVYTDPSDRFPEGQVSLGAEFFEDHAHLDPIFDLFALRESLQKMIGTELPRMTIRNEHKQVVADAPCVHPQFDSIKETGRSSSFGSDNLPSFNCQNVLPAARPCYVARPGKLLTSSDFNYMELVTWAQACYSNFGVSRLRDIINADMDPHGWLGSILASRIDPQFQLYTAGMSEEAVYHAFLSLKKGEDDQRKFFKLWRNYAKPTGLGYPGGLAAETMVAYSKANYHIILTLDMAQQLRDVWMEALPEAAMWFDWVKSQEDPYNVTYWKRKNEDGSEERIEQGALGYFSPLGMYRAGCKYTEVANGAGLQTFAADGMMLAEIDVMLACIDPRVGSKLCGRAFPLMDVHDELISEVDDDGHAHEYAQEIADRMVESFGCVLPDLKIKSQPVLMRRWNKNAEPVFDEAGRLQVWEEPVPKVE